MGNNSLRVKVLIAFACVLVFGALVLGVRKAREHRHAVSDQAVSQTSDRPQQQQAEHADLQTQGSSPTSPVAPLPQGQAQGKEAAALPTAAQAHPEAHAEALSAPQPTCFIESFHHKPTPGHTDEEACSRHRNLLQLAHANVSPSHLCVRVNGIPVKYERKGDEVLIGSIAGPKAKITVSYCLGKSNCHELANEDCTIPKDEFMEALGGDTDTASAQWGDNGKLNADVKKELQDIDGANGGEDRAPAQADIFKGWVRDQNAAACKANPSS